MLERLDELVIDSELIESIRNGTKRFTVRLGERRMKLNFNFISSTNKYDKVKVKFKKLEFRKYTTNMNLQKYYKDIKVNDLCSIIYFEVDNTKEKYERPIRIHKRRVGTAYNRRIRKPYGKIKTA